jgi:hypothetical protein
MWPKPARAKASFLEGDSRNVEATRFRFCMSTSHRNRLIVGSNLAQSVQPVQWLSFLLVGEEPLYRYKIALLGPHDISELRFENKVEFNEKGLFRFLKAVRY